MRPTAKLCAGCYMKAEDDLLVKLVQEDQCERKATHNVNKVDPPDLSSEDA